MAEKLELTHLMTAEHQKHTKKKKTNKATQHRGTQERRSDRWRPSVQDRAQKKTCRVQRQRSDSHTGGCISAQRGALEVSCLETWTSSCVEIHAERSATGRQSRTSEETGLCRDS